jgi:hypothetical protein
MFEDVPLNREHFLIVAQVRFKGDATKVLRIQLPARAWQLRKTKTRDRRRKALMGGVAISWG